MENMVAIESSFWSRGGVQNFLVSAERGASMANHTWTCFNRLNKDSVEKIIRQANILDRYIAVSYHDTTGEKECFELYVRVERAIELIEDESKFVFKFIMLSQSVTDEYKMFS